MNMNNQGMDVRESARQPQAHFLLDDLQSPINIGKCARVAEAFGMGLYIHDPRKITRNSEALQTIGDFSCGAWERRKNLVLDDIHGFIKNYKKGRLVATCLREDAVRLHDFEFAENDLILFGNEYDGLSREIVENADAKVYIALPKAYLPKPHTPRSIDSSRAMVNRNGVPSLNVAVAAGIVAYAFSCWLEKNRYALESNAHEGAQVAAY